MNPQGTEMAGWPVAETRRPHDRELDEADRPTPGLDGAKDAARLRLRGNPGLGTERYRGFESHSLRHSVRSCRDFPLARPHSLRNLRDSAGSWPSSPRVSEPETTGPGPGRRRGPRLSLLPSWAVRFRSRFACWELAGRRAVLGRQACSIAHGTSSTARSGSRNSIPVGQDLGDD